VLPLAGTPDAPNLNTRRAYLEISTALHQTFMHFRHRFLTEREILDTENQGEGWHECLVDARQLVTHVSDLWALRIRSGYTKTGAVG